MSYASSEVSIQNMHNFSKAILHCFSDSATLIVFWLLYILIELTLVSYSYQGLVWNEKCEGYRHFSETCTLLTSILFVLYQEIFKCMLSSLWAHLSFTVFQRDFTVCVAAVDGSRAPAIEASAGAKRHTDCLGVSKQREQTELFITKVKSSWNACLNRKPPPPPWLCSTAAKWLVAPEVNTEGAQDEVKKTCGFMTSRIQLFFKAKEVNFTTHILHLLIEEKCSYKGNMLCGTILPKNGRAGLKISISLYESILNFMTNWHRFLNPQLIFWSMLFS